MKAPTGKEIQQKPATPAASSSSAIQTAVIPPAAPTPLRKPPFWTLPVTGLPFLAWLGYLFFLVETLPHAPGGGPIILSRPQFLVSQLDVIAQIESPAASLLISAVGQAGGLPNPWQALWVAETMIKTENPASSVVIKEVSYPSSLGGNRLVGQTIVVTNLGRCRAKRDGGPLDFTGPGEYILALRPTPLAFAAGLAGLAGSPGLAGPLLIASQPYPDVGLSLSYEVVPTPPSPGYSLGQPRIYRAIDATRAQLRQIPKPE